MSYVSNEFYINLIRTLKNDVKEALLVKQSVHLINETMYLYIDQCLIIQRGHFRSLGFREKQNISIF